MCVCVFVCVYRTHTKNKVLILLPLKPFYIILIMCQQIILRIQLQYVYI